MNNLSLLRTKWSAALTTPILHHRLQLFRSVAALEALQSHLSPESEPPPLPRHLVLYNYPSFSGAFAALFAHLYHSRLNLPCLILPFSSVEPLRPSDFRSGPIDTCYLLDFIGPNTFAVYLSHFIPRVIAFDHRSSAIVRVSQLGQLPENLVLNINTNNSSARAVYDYFSEKIDGPLIHEDADRVAAVLRYIEDADLRRWELPDAEAFKLGIRDERGKLNCLVNPCMFEQLLKINHRCLIAKGNEYISSRREAADKLVGGAFRIRLGRGLYGECLVQARRHPVPTRALIPVAQKDESQDAVSAKGSETEEVVQAIRADGNSNLSHEIGVELSRRSLAAGLRPIGAVIFMQRLNLKMCLRSTDSATDTSEIAKAYGGGGNAGSSSFIIRMDEYNHWTSVNWLNRERYMPTIPTISSVTGEDTHPSTITY